MAMLAMDPRLCELQKEGNGISEEWLEIEAEADAWRFGVTENLKYGFLNQKTDFH